MDKHRHGGIRRKIKVLFRRIRSSFSKAMHRKSCDRQMLIYDLLLFSVGFLLSRCHLLFGVRPIGLAFICAIPTGVWSALFGSVIGYLSLGANGLIFAAVTAVAIFLRVAIGFSDKPSLFKEALSITSEFNISSVPRFSKLVYNQSFAPRAVRSYETEG